MAQQPSQTINQNPTSGPQSILHPILGSKKEITDLTGRVAVVTGGALGIGYEEEQGESAIKKIKDESGGKAQIEWLPCDLGNLKQMKDVFGGIRERENRLDLLILAAGIYANEYGESADGIERIFAVNWLGQFYAVNQLYPLLRKTSKFPTRLPRGSKEEINDPSKDPTQFYPRTKLAMILGAKYGLIERVIKPNEVNTEIQHQWKSAYPGLLGKLLTTIHVQYTPASIIAAPRSDSQYLGLNGCIRNEPSPPKPDSGPESIRADEEALVLDPRDNSGSAENQGEHQFLALI
ncbi:hypothetical protein BDW66DRAFT_163082 [Aspergillus desertorum]